MMESLKGWVLAVCVAAVAGGLVQLVAPAGGTQKILRLTISVFFLCALFAPVLKGAAHSDGVDWPGTQMESLPETASAVEEQLLRQTEDRFSATLEGLTAQALEEMGIEADKIAVSVHTNEDGSISITEISLELKPEDQSKQAAIEQQVEEKLGQKPQVAVTAGGS